MRVRKLPALLLALVMVFSVTVFTYAADGTGGQTTITLLHVNDSHGRYVKGTDGSMGIDTIAAIKKTMGDNVLLIDVGDTIHGLPFVDLNEGADAVKLMEAAGFDIWTPGNHDFNYGYLRLLELSDDISFDFISANVTRDGEALFKPYVIKEIAGIKIAFFGLTTPETAFKSHPGKNRGVDYEDPITVAKAMVAELEDKADYIVALAHLGIEAEEGSENWVSPAVAAAVDGIDLIIDGHSHSPWSADYVYNGTRVLTAFQYENVLGIVKLTFDENNECIQLAYDRVTAEEAAELYEPDEAVSAVIETIELEQDVELSVVVAASPLFFNSDRVYARTQEVALGNFVADAMLDATLADIALTNGGGLRADIQQGPVTKGDIAKVLPFGNFGVTKYVTPAILKAAMENGVESYPGQMGGFPQIAGFSFTFNPDLPVGSRVLRIEYQGKELDLTDNTTTLLMVTNDYMAAGGDKYTMFESLPTVGQFQTLKEMFEEYFEHMDELTIAARYSKTGNRVIEMHPVTLPAEVPPDIVVLPDTTPVTTLPAEIPPDLLPTTKPLPIEDATVVGAAPQTRPVATPDNPYPEGALGVVSNCYFLNVRGGAGMSYDPIAYLARGDSVIVLDYKYGWVLITMADLSGWVYSDYLTVQ